MDSRFHLKAEFTIYGQTHKYDCSLNWSADPGEIDVRITAWFLQRYNESYTTWLEQLHANELERDQKLIEQAERAELARLKAKYEYEQA